MVEEGSGAEDGEVVVQVVMIRHHPIRDTQEVNQVRGSRDGSRVSGLVRWVVLQRDIWLGIEVAGKKREEDCLVAAMEVGMVVEVGMGVVRLEAREDQAGVEVGVVRGRGMRVLALDRHLGDRPDEIV